MIDPVLLERDDYYSGVQAALDQIIMHLQRYGAVSCGLEANKDGQWISLEDIKKLKKEMGG